MPSTFYLKRGNTRPHLDVTLYDTTGSVLDLTGKTVTFRMHDTASGRLKVNRPVDTNGGTAGTARVTFTPAESDTDGIYPCEFHVDDGAGVVQVVPNFGTLTVIISPALG